MKTVLLAGLLLTGLYSCSKNQHDPTPSAPSLTGGTWALTSQIVVTTPKNGGTSTTQNNLVVPNTVTLVYSTDGKFTVTTDKSISINNTTSIGTGTYTYSGTTLTSTINGQTSTARVDVLTSNTLTTVNLNEDSSARYTLTETWKR